MTLRIHISSHNDDLHKGTSKRNLAGGVTGLDVSGLVDTEHLPFNNLSVSMFQTNTGTGTSTNPQNINNNNTSSFTIFDDINEYTEIILPSNCIIYEFRHYGSAIHNGDGKYKIQHYRDGIWVDNTIDILTQLVGWSSWIKLSELIGSTKIRIICTLLDTKNNMNVIYELEVRGL